MYPRTIITYNKVVNKENKKNKERLNEHSQLVETIKEGIQEKKVKILLSPTSVKCMAPSPNISSSAGWITYTVEAIAESSGRTSLAPRQPWREAGERLEVWVGGYGLCGCSRSHLFLPEGRAYYDLEHLGTTAQAYPYSEFLLIPKNAEHWDRLYRCF